MHKSTRKSIWIPIENNHSLKLFIADTDRLISGDQYGTVNFWRIPNGELLNSVAISPDDETLITGNMYYYFMKE